MHRKIRVGCWFFLQRRRRRLRIQFKRKESCLKSEDLQKEILVVGTKEKKMIACLNRSCIQNERAYICIFIYILLLLSNLLLFWENGISDHNKE